MKFDSLRYRQVLFGIYSRSPSNEIFCGVSVAPLRSRWLPLMICGGLSDVSAKLKVDRPPTKLQTIRNLSSYVTDRLKKVDVIDNCSDIERLQPRSARRPC